MDHIGISKGHTYPVGGLHRYFEGSHVPGCRGVSNTPTRWPRKERKQDSFLKGSTYPVGELHRYFEESHIPDCRGVSHTPHKRPRRGRKRGGFSKGRTYPAVGTYCIRPTIRHRRWRIQIHFLNPRTYPVVGIASVFRRVTRIRLGVLHQYFEESYVSGCRGVCNTPHHTPPTVANTGPFFDPPHVPGRGIASVFQRIARTQSGDHIGISKNRTYPVGGSHRYFEESHVPGRGIASVFRSITRTRS